MSHRPKQLLRRAFMRSGAASLAMVGGIATPALAQLRVENSPVPQQRPRGIEAEALSRGADAIVSKANIDGQVCFAVADARTGVTLAERSARLPMPPASTAKAITSAYAVDHLGPAFQFETRILGTGPLRGGRLEGDLILEGGGDPSLSTGGMARLLRDLRDLGVREVTGRFLVWTGALPYVEEIVPSQPDHLGYNPAISGLNLNFNRVHFEWLRRGNDYRLTMDARDGNLIPPVRMATMRAVDRDRPIYDVTRDPATGIEAWTVSRPALGAAGARWLPVRGVSLYAAEVFRTLARDQGLDLPAPEFLANRPRGTPLALRNSAPLSEVSRAMMRYSTNLTAEVLGLAASQVSQGRQPADLLQSAGLMNRWARRIGMPNARFSDHSGLNDASRVTSEDMVSALVTLGANGPIKPLMRQITLKTPSGQAERFELRAKTGTLNFVSGLVGYIDPPGRGTLAFAILTANLDRRAAIAPGDEERPPGAIGWARRSREMQWNLVRHWAKAG